MFNIGDNVVYKRDVCKINDLHVIKDKLYYVLIPINDSSLSITIPESSTSNCMRKIISNIDSEKLISSIPNIEVINTQTKQLENQYKILLNSGKKEDLIKIIKTTYLRNKERLSNNKKIGEKDDNYFRKAEKLLYDELSISLGKTYEDTKKYVCDRVSKLVL